MTPIDDDRLLNAYVDGELNLDRQLEVEQRILVDAALARRVADLRSVREAIRDGASYHRSPPALRRRWSGGAAPAPRRLPPGSFGWGAAARRWLDWRPLVGSLGVVALLITAWSAGRLQASHDDRLIDDVLASHVRSTLDEHLVDIASSDHHAVKPWLSSKLDFSPPVAEPRLPGLTFAGGRLDHVGGHAAAALVYRRGAHVVNSYIWPTDAADSAPFLEQARGFRTAHWVHQRMARWVISDVGAAEFEAIVEAIRAADASP
ncbi:MAG: hypothetical protein M3O01_03680 [Pseudomonadota bacterium]|nr:hypothetical protein [Pseudomonadota bacterium]